MGNCKIALIQVWLGPFPDYFKYHLKTCKYQSNIDFLIFTDHEIKLKLPSNVKTFSITKSEIEDKISKLVGSSVILANNRKANELKASYGDLFKEYLTEYDYIGFYDIDTLLGDLYNWVNPYLGKYNFITSTVKIYHDQRLTGPFTIWENKEELNTLYKNLNFTEIIKQKEVSCFEEQEFSDHVINNYSVKLIYNSQNSDSSGKVIYESLWSGGKAYCNNKEIMLHHFYNKNTTKLSFRGNVIISEYKKDLIEDFYWITCFTKSYEPIIKGLIKSIQKYSNRKCIFYTLNYDSDLKFKLDEQFIFRRLDLEQGNIDKQGRDITVLSSKPKILSDSIDFVPNGKFIFIDTDIYFTNVVDNLKDYFSQLDDYPLFNSHIHDKILANDILESKEWVSPIDILSKATNIPVRVFPRRKTNVIVYDYKSKWFFDEQMEIWNQYKDTEPGIFRLHDEDSANILLSKYNFQTSLPLIDMEESSTLNLEKFKNYSYNQSAISEHVKLPQNFNEIPLFHGYKDPNFYKEIEKNYGKTVLSQDDFIVEFKDNKFWWTKNSFLVDKEIQPIVRFEVLRDNKILWTFSNQELFNYWSFFISECSVEKGYYDMRIVEEKSNRIIYNNIIKI